MAVDETSQTAQNARRSHQARARARHRDLTERLNVFAKAVGLGVLIVLIGIGAFGRFYSIRFNGLASADAMDAGQIAEQLRYGRGLSTRVIRPLALSYAGVNEDGVMPEMLHAPLYPLLLSWLFKVRGGGDASVVMFNGLAFLLTGWVLYAIARRLWEKTTGVVVVILYFVSVEALGNVLTASGASLTGLLITLAIWAALRQRETLEAIQEQSQGLTDRRWFIGPAIVGGLFGLTYLAGLASLLLVLPLAFLAITRARRLQQAAVMAIVALVVMVPWFVHNLAATHTLFPALSTYKLLTYTDTYPDNSVFQQLPGQVPSPASFIVAHPGELVKKVAWGLTRLYRPVARLVSPYLFPFFLLGGLWFGAASPRRALWRTVMAMLAIQVLTICLYEHNLEAIMLFTPIVLCLAAGGGLQALRGTGASRLSQGLVIGAVFAVVLFPTVGSMVLGGRVEIDRSAASLGLLRKGLTSDAVIATDKAPAVAWSASKQAVLLPSKPEDLRVLEEQGITVDYVYFSHKVLGPEIRPYFQPWRSEKAAEYLGKPLAIGYGEMLFERNDKRAVGDVGSTG